MNYDNKKPVSMFLSLISLTFAMPAAADIPSNPPFIVTGSGDFHASSAPGSLEEYVTTQARIRSKRDAVRKCNQEGFDGQPLQLDGEVVNVGIENGSVWATVDADFHCTHFSTINPTVAGEGVGTAIISVPNARASAKSKAMIQAKNKCEQLGYYQLPDLRIVWDDHWSCVGHDCTAWFSGLYECR